MSEGGTAVRRAAWRGAQRVVCAGAGACGAVAIGWTLWFALAWLLYGHPGANGEPDPLIDRFMPTYEVAERHTMRVAASVARTYIAARGVDLERAAIVHAVFEGRRRLFGEPETRGGRLTLGQLEAMGWRVLVEVPGRELVFGAVTQPWHGNPGFRPLPPESFAAFDSAGYAKIVWTLAADSLGPNQSRFRTETRVITTDPESRSRFRRYWSWLSPGILLIRWQAIRLVRADAERLVEVAP
ncbi:MAG TPA: hypothetical protein VLV16_13060 [Gemmatimonadales bacterium]|nr:hypothetical protein [Gemmatimonadales bacterium]